MKISIWDSQFDSILSKTAITMNGIIIITITMNGIIIRPVYQVSIKMQAVAYYHGS